MSKLQYKIFVIVLGILYHMFIKHNNKAYKLNKKGKKEKAQKAAKRAIEIGLAICLGYKEVEKAANCMNKKIKNGHYMTNSEYKAHCYILSVSESLYLRAEQVKEAGLCLHNDFFKGE